MAYPASSGKPTFREFITPIGLLVHLYHDEPMLRTEQNSRKPILDENGVQEAEFKVTMVWDKPKVNAGLLNEFIGLAHEVKAEAWPDSVKPGAFFALEPFLRDGDNPAHNTKGREYLRNCYYLNFKQKAKPERMADGKIKYTGNPGIIGPYNEDIMPLDVWSGCTGRVSGVMFGSEYMGRNFISTRLNNIQKFEGGDRIGGASRPDPRSQFQPLMAGSPAGVSGDPFGGLGGGLGGALGGNGGPRLF